MPVPQDDDRVPDERPNEFPDRPPTEVPALDEAPDGMNPGQADDSDEDSLPPGASPDP